MRKATFAAAAAVLLGLSGAATAADLYGGSMKDAPVYAPVNTWSGFYFGINGGYGWDASSSKDLSAYTPYGDGYGLTVPGTKLDPSGGFGGAQIGINWQRGPIVYGVEADIQISDISDDRTTTFPIFDEGFIGVNRKTALDWFGTVRGRIGYTVWDNALVYFTGGLAYGKVRDEVNLVGGFGRFGLNLGLLAREDIDTGYVLGGGVEFKPNWAFLSGPNWTVKAEYQYINLGSEKINGNIIVPISTNSIDHEYHTFRVGLNYHIPSGYEPLK